MIPGTPMRRSVNAPPVSASRLMMFASPRAPPILRLTSSSTWGYWPAHEMVLVKVSRSTAGAGLTLAVAFLALRIWPLDTLMWVMFTAVGAISGYAIGLILPGADDELIDILDEQDVLDAVVGAKAEF